MGANKQRPQVRSGFWKPISSTNKEVAFHCHYPWCRTVSLVESHRFWDPSLSYHVSCLIDNPSQTLLLSKTRILANSYTKFTHHRANAVCHRALPSEQNARHLLPKALLVTFRSPPRVALGIQHPDQASGPTERPTRAWRKARAVPRNSPRAGWAFRRAVEAQASSI